MMNSIRQLVLLLVAAAAPLGITQTAKAACNGWIIESFTWLNSSGNSTSSCPSGIYGVDIQVKNTTSFDRLLGTALVTWSPSTSNCLGHNHQWTNLPVCAGCTVGLHVQDIVIPDDCQCVRRFATVGITDDNGFACDSKILDCTPPDGTSCDDDNFCNGDDECRNGSCSDHDGNPCGDCTYCSNDTCHDYDCCDDDDCDSCEHCDNNNRCSEYDCCNDNDCTGSCSYCDVHTCRNYDCCDDDDCDSCEYCDNNSTCQEHECCNHSDCGNLQKCSNHSCLSSCNDGICDTNFGENCDTCPQDCSCKTGSCCVGFSCSVTTKANCTGTWSDGGDCTQNPCRCNNNGICDTGEDCSSCPNDCDPSCGDGTCECGETSSSCCNDCPCPIGQNCIAGTCDGPSSDLHPADQPPYCDNEICGDRRVKLGEVIGYAAAWKRGDHDEFEYAIRGLFLYRKSECYEWDDLTNNWVSRTCE